MEPEQDEWGPMDDQSRNNARPSEVYANNANVTISAYDFAISFGIGDGETTETQVTVRMSPQHAKSVMILLERFVGIYESQVAPIELPQGLLDMLRGEAKPNGTEHDN